MDPAAEHAGTDDAVSAGQPEPVAVEPVAVEPVAVEPVAADSVLAGQQAEASRPVVAVTGAARGLGLALTARLAQSPLVGRVVALDDNRGDVSGVTWRIVDVRDPALAGGYPT